MSLTQFRWLARSVVQCGDSAAVNIPAAVARDVGGLDTGPGGDSVDLEYDSEERTLTVHLPDETDN